MLNVVDMKNRQLGRVSFTNLFFNPPEKANRCVSEKTVHCLCTGVSPACEICSAEFVLCLTALSTQIANLLPRISYKKRRLFVKYLVHFLYPLFGNFK